LSDGKNNKERKELLMQEWASMINYWATDNSILWQRCSIFLLVNSIFFAPIAIISENTLLPICFLKFGIPIFAIIINVLWWLVTLRSVAVIKSFEQLNDEIKKEIPTLRFYNIEDRKKYFICFYQRVEGKKHILNLLPSSFIVLWLCILFFI
jgi:hypothetical protein